MKTKCKIWLKCQFSHTTVNHRKILNAPLDALMCPLQIINDIEPLSLTLHGVNACFIHHPSNVENYSISHKSETDRPKPKKKSYSGQPILTPFCQFFGQNSKYPILQKPANFSTCRKLALKGPANGPQVRYSKIQNRLSRVPLDTPMDWFLIQYISNKCALILRESVKKWYSTFDGP